ncbi:hypothetical protein [Paracoccus chinensis]|uniref:Twin-arginine translocation signal domain-containing protein n=1 Tax=Paracoccus chinensis TaxID=525640 RepID=A0A1G9H8T3_9RHOB|nr:hypothetical protein [Paracoccus chinensis]SDL09267.1 hypothetical protein SAMN04487971_10672 [Paracoccus chinensis]
MNRRALLKAAPALALAGAAPAQGITMMVTPSTETPVATLFREWRAHSAWLNEPETAECPEDQFNAHCAENVRMIEQMCGEPCRDMADLCLKLLAVTDFGKDIQFPELATKDQLAADVRALVGA